jgi:hypothetical protein
MKIANRLKRFENGNENLKTTKIVAKNKLQRKKARGRAQFKGRGTRGIVYENPKIIWRILKRERT